MERFVVLLTPSDNPSLKVDPPFPKALVTELIPNGVDIVAVWSEGELSRRKIPEGTTPVLIPCTKAIVKDFSLTRKYGSIQFTRRGELVTTKLTSVHQIPSSHYLTAWPCNNEDRDFFQRRSLWQSNSVLTDLPDCFGLYVSRFDSSIPKELFQRASSIWSAGAATWGKLISQGYVVNGSADGLGFNELLDLPQQLRPKHWIIVTHQDAPTRPGTTTIKAYQLVPSRAFPTLSQKSLFFWRSATLFKEALKHYPGIIDGWHGVGPGETYEVISNYVCQSHIEVFLDYDDWRLKRIYGMQTATTLEVKQAHT